MRSYVAVLMCLGCVGAGGDTWDGWEGPWVGAVATDGGCAVLPNPAVLTIDRANRTGVGMTFEGTQCGAVSAEVTVAGDAVFGYQMCGAFTLLGGRLHRGAISLDLEASTISGSCEATASGTLARSAK